jgi:hypothetical protein
MGTSVSPWLEVLCLAWRHRASRPVIWVHTSPEGADAHAPRVTVMPRSVWEASPCAKATANFFNSAGFQVDAEYIVAFDLLHPGRD